MGIIQGLIQRGGDPGNPPAPIFTMSAMHIVQIFKTYSNTLSPVPAYHNMIIVVSQALSKILPDPIPGIS